MIVQPRREAAFVRRGQAVTAALFSSSALFSFLPRSLRFRAFLRFPRCVRARCMPGESGRYLTGLPGLLGLGAIYSNLETSNMPPQIDGHSLASS